MVGVEVQDRIPQHLEFDVKVSRENDHWSVQVHSETAILPPEADASEVADTVAGMVAELLESVAV